MTPGLFVVGTDTNVGKTFVAAALVRRLKAEGHRVGVLKPIATGAILGPSGRWQSEDAETLIEALGGVDQPPIERVVPMLYQRPLAPSVAARLEGCPLQWSLVRQTVGSALEWWSQRADVLIVEGIGGFLCPIADDATVADLAIALDFPLLIVGRRGLGTLNHCLLTVEAAQRRGLRIAGLILNGSEPTTNEPAESTNAAELGRRLDGVPILAELPHGISAPMLDIALGTALWYDRARVPRCPFPTAMIEGTPTRRAGSLDGPFQDPRRTRSAHTDGE